MVVVVVFVCFRATVVTAAPKAMVLFKVGVSCYAAVLFDAKLKGFSSISP